MKQDLKAKIQMKSIKEQRLWENKQNMVLMAIKKIPISWAIGLKQLWIS